MKEKIELEYILKTSPKVLFPRLSTATGLAEWFADNVTVKNKTQYAFHWDKSIEEAEQTYIRENVVVKYEWKNKDEKAFFEFRIRIDDLTGEMALIVTDMVDSDEKDEIIDLWDIQINKLKHVLGL
ncbi:MAG TPA: START-like domain-containing protein [Bacteroidales bacterium]|nr:START-like domain-containing protein [Bacteroidales bacterium]